MLPFVHSLQAGPGKPGLCHAYPTSAVPGTAVPAEYNPTKDYLSNLAREHQTYRTSCGPCGLSHAVGRLHCGGPSLRGRKVKSSGNSPGPTSFLLVSYSYPPTLGGSEVEAQRICAEMVNRGYGVTVLCAGGGPMPTVARWVDPYGVPVRMFGGRWPGAWRDRAFALGVAWTILAERRNYRFVYFLMQGLHLATGLPVARLLGKPIIMKFSGSNLVTLLRDSWLGRWELRRLRQWARRIMILNPGMEQEAIQAGFLPQQLLRMPNPVDVEVFAPPSAELRSYLRAGLGIPADAQVILYVGRLAPEKELPSLIRAFAGIACQLPWARLVLVGDGPERGALVALTAALGVDSKVRFTGSLAAADVLRWLQLSDAFALLSSLEGFSCSLLEAMAIGLPSVVSDIPANRQLVEHEVHGLVVGLRDEAAIGGALARLLGDASLRVRLGLGARALVVANYSIEKVANRYEALFEEILG